MEYGDFLTKVVRTPLWMPEPWAWNWVAPDGAMQGFGMAGLDDGGGPRPGYANLLWLAADLPAPPAARTFDARRVPLYMWVVLNHRRHLVAGVPLEDVVTNCTLKVFAEGFPGITSGPLHELADLAKRRLAHAHS